MWVRTGQLQQIDSALEAGRAEDIDGLIADILRSGASELSTSNACAVCRRELGRGHPTARRPGGAVSRCSARSSPRR